MKLREKWVILTLLLAVVLGGCQQGISGAGQQTPVDLSSPRALIAAVRKSVDSHDHQMLLQCMDPAHRGPLREIYQLMHKHDPLVDDVSALIADRIGKAQAQAFRKRVLAACPQPFDPRLFGDESKIEIAVTGNTAMLTKGTATLGSVIRRPDGRWYVVARPPRAVVNKDELRMLRRLMWYRMKTLEILKRKIASGEITKENYASVLPGASSDGTLSSFGARKLKEPFGAALMGVRIQVIPLREAFAVGEPIGFFVSFRYGPGTRIGFWWPDEGFGGNAVLEIDGKVVQVSPDPFAGKHLEYWDSGGGTDGIGLGLPKTIKLSPGKHTFRYTLINHGGVETLYNGEKIPMLRGELVSNTVTFVVKSKKRLQGQIPK